jgi:hypothetical protein
MSKKKDCGVEYEGWKLFVFDSYQMRNNFKKVFDLDAFPI